MKTLVISILGILFIAGTSCQQLVNVEKEKEAIMALLEKESAAVIAEDVDAVFALHVKDDMETRLEMGVYGYNTYKGWDEVGTLLGDAHAGPGILGGEDAVNRKENVILKVTGNTAWLTCDNIWEWTVDGNKEGFNNIQVNFLEKIKGEWLISFAAYYTKPQP